MKSDMSFMSGTSKPTILSSCEMLVCKTNTLQIVDANDAALRGCEMTREELIGKSLSDIVIRPDTEEENGNRRGISEEDLHLQNIWTMQGKSGFVRSVRLTSQWIYEDDKILRLIIVHPLNGDHLDDLLINRTVDNLRLLGDTSLFGIYVIQNMSFRYVSSRFCEILGYEEPELIKNVSPIELVHPDQRNEIQELERRWHEEALNSFEINVKALDRWDQPLHLHLFGTRVRLSEENSATVGVIIDESKHNEAIENFKMSLESYKALFDSIGDAIYIQDKEGKFLEVNDGAANLYGFDKSEMIGKDPELLAAPGKVDLDDTMNKFNKALDGEPQRFEWWGKRKNGEIFPKEVHLNPGYYFGEKVVIAIARDNSEQFYRQEQIKESEELLRQLFMNAPIGIALLDEHHEVKMVNKGFEELFSINQDEIIGLDIDKVIVPDGKEDEAFQLTRSHEVFEVSTRRKRSDGEEIDVLIYGVPVVVEGKTIAIYGIYVDISDRKRAEEKVRRSLKEKEVLLSEIHHRVKNNLAVITGLLELQVYNTEDLSTQKALKDSQARINSMALIHEKLYQSENLSRIQFDTYIQQLIKEISASHIPKSRPVDFDIQADPVPLTITQAIPCGLLLNELVTNALKHAFDRQPESSRKPDKDCITIRFESVGNQRLRFEVADNGVGLPDNYREKKSQSLGMTLIHTLAKQLEADFQIRNTDEGAQFELKFDYDKVAEHEEG